MSVLVRRIVGALLLVILIAGGITLLRSGVYGWTVFVVFPVMLGGLGSWVFRPTSGGGAAATGALTVAVASCSLLILGFEGVICVGMALFLCAPLGALGGWLIYRAEPSRLATGGGVAMLLLLPPAGVIWDTQSRPRCSKCAARWRSTRPPNESGGTW
jgi:hypothetical protein